METSYELIPSAAQRHIIKRPRLTRLLASAKGRILVLVAPAGFGKTTLAREWVADKPHAWYRGAASSADVAALAAGLSEAVRVIVPGAGERMVQRMRATGTPEQDVQPLAELLSEDLVDWPDDAWLVIDDYQFAMESDASEQFVDMVLRLSPVRVLLTSRNRPSWATARRLLYGEVYEVGRNELAMTQDEAAEVLFETNDEAAPGLVALADGWPAVIGLAALSPGFELPDNSLPDALYRYFAEELYQAATPETRKGLAQLAVAPTLLPGLAEQLLAEHASWVIDEGAALGFFTSARGGDIHPLLRTFLVARAREDGIELEPTRRVLADAFAAATMWDEAVALAEDLGDAALFIAVLEQALPDLLRAGRVATLTDLVQKAVAQRLDAPVIDLAEAELAFRRGDRRASEALAESAALRFTSAHPLSSRASYLAGLSAQLDFRTQAAVAHYSTARARAGTMAARRDALSGLITAHLNAGAPSVAGLLDELAELDDGSAPSRVRLGIARVISAMRNGTVHDAYRAVIDAERFAHRVADPLAYSSLLALHAHALVLSARYSEAIAKARDGEGYAREERLGFALPHIRRTRVLAEMGLRHFARAARVLEALDVSIGPDDTFMRVEIKMTRARLLLAQGLNERAIAELEDRPSAFPYPAEGSEYDALLALAYVSIKDIDAAERHLTAAEASSVEARAYIACCRAAGAVLRDPGRGAPVAIKAMKEVFDIGNLDALVLAYRVCPQLLQVGLSSTLSSDLATLVRCAGDTDFARRASPGQLRAQRGSGERLTVREEEVLGLVAQGLANKEIARALFISESTVKVHLQHIYDKLGVRKRSAAAMIASEDRS